MDGLSKRKPKKRQIRSTHRRNISTKTTSKKTPSKPVDVKRTFSDKKINYTYSDTKNFAPNKASVSKKTKKPRDKSKSLFFISIALFLISIIFLLMFLVFKATNTLNNDVSQDSFNDTKSSQAKNSNQSFFSTLSQLAQKGDETALSGYENGRINILLLGIAGTQKPGSNLTDTIMIASIDTKNHLVSLISLPRDLLVKYKNSYMKINSVYTRGLANETGIQDIKDTIQKITGQKINYHIILDFQGFIDVIDALGGININVPRDINDTKYPGPGYSYETFKISKGLQHLDGTTALKYARSRHEDPESDFGRAKRQQQVLKAARNKAFTIGTIANPFKINDLINAIGKHVRMNIKPKEITSFIALVNNLDTHNITTFVVDAWQKDSLLISTRIGNLPGLTPRSGNWKEIQEIARNIFSIDKIKERKTQISIENPSILIISFENNIITKNNLLKHLQGRGFSDIKFLQTKRGLKAPDTTIILDKNGGKYLTSLDELIEQLNGKIQKELPGNIKDLKELSNNDADFIVILSDDALKTYNHKNLTKEEFTNLSNKENEK